MMPRRGERLAVLRGGPCDGLVRAIQCDVLVVPLMPELPGEFDPECGGWHVTAEEAMTPLPPYTEARYRVTDETSEGYAVYQYERP